MIALIEFLGLLVVAPAAAQTTDSKSLEEVNKELSNPISSIWALQLQENTYWLNKPDRNVVNLQFQPVLPLALTDDWNLITRPVFQVMNSTPYVNESGKFSSRHRLWRHDPRNFDLTQPEIGRSVAVWSGSQLHLPYGKQLAGSDRTNGRSDLRAYSAILATNGLLESFHNSGFRSGGQARRPSAR